MSNVTSKGDDGLSNIGTVFRHLRKSKGMPQLEIIIVPLVEDQEGKVISSTRIREGEIDINGDKLNF